jgi:hypothetical protein
MDREFPEISFGAALARRVEDMLAGTNLKTIEAEQVPAVSSLSNDMLMDLAISDGPNCVVWNLTATSTGPSYRSKRWPRLDGEPRRGRTPAPYLRNSLSAYANRACRSHPAR